MKLFLPHLLFTLFVFLLGPTLSAQGISLSRFEVRAEGANVIVNWEVEDETGVTEYRLYRRVGETEQFEAIATVHADGLQTYTYIDDQIFKNEERVVHYELKVMHRGEQFSFYSSLSHNPTAVQRTWGSIKSMFQ